MAISKKELLEVLRKSKNREVMSDFIRIGTSDLYDYEPVRRAVLREIAFLQQNDDKKKTPEDSPFAGDYVGWCWASQRYIAARVGNSEDYVNECVAQFEKDGVIRVRAWDDSLGYPHAEYQIVSQVVEAHQRPEGYLKQKRHKPRQGGNKTANAGSFKPGNRAAKRKESRTGSQPYGTEFAAVTQPSSQALPSESAAVLPAGFAGVLETGANPLKGVAYTAGVGSLRSPLENIDLGGATSSAASDLASSAPPAADAGLEKPDVHDDEEQTQTPLKVQSNGLLAELNQKPKRPMGTVVKGERKPLPNRLCYPDAFKNWKRGMRVPRCRVCKENLYPEENHVCEGYKPQLPFMDMSAHMERMQDQREEHHEASVNNRAERRKRGLLEYEDEENLRRVTCPRCGEPVDEMDALAHDAEDCRGYMTL